jgi:Arm DNA-binding domain
LILIASLKLSVCLNEVWVLFRVSALLATGDALKMLTYSQISSAKPTSKPRKLFDTRGLYLKVMPNGGRYWRFDYQFNGKYKTLALGTYPDVPLARARERHHEARRQLSDGIDPGAVKQAVSRDFESVARAWLAHWRAGRSERYVAYVIGRLESDVFPDIGSRPASEITAVEFRNVAQKIERCARISGVNSTG